MPSISIIMPAYNAEASIVRSMESIQGQTWAEWELIVVDDGSTDQTIERARELASEDHRIRVVETSHRGVVEAREIGVRKARGTYIMFCDADDWIEPQALENMYICMQEHALDLCVTGYYRDVFYGTKNRCVAELCSVEDAIFETADDFRLASAELFAEGLFQGVNGILYRASYLADKHISFESCGWSEHDFILTYLYDLQRVGVLAWPYYHFQTLRHEQRTPQRELEILELCQRDYDTLLALYTEWGLIDNHEVYQKIHEIFLNELTACIEDICNPSCVINIEHKHQILETIVNAESTQKAVSVVSPKNRMQQMLIGPIKKKNTQLLYSEARFISFIKHYNSSTVSCIELDGEEGEAHE